MTSSHPLALDQQLCFSLYRASRLVTRTYQGLLKELNLTYPQYLVMLVLWEENQSVGMKELAERLDLDSGTLTPLVKRLTALGLVVKERDPADERRALLTLTLAGRELKTKAQGIPGDIYRACATRGLNLGTLKEDLDTLNEHLSN